MIGLQTQNRIKFKYVVMVAACAYILLTGAFTKAWGYELLKVSTENNIYLEMKFHTESEMHSWLKIKITSSVFSLKIIQICILWLYFNKTYCQSSFTLRPPTGVKNVGPTFSLSYLTCGGGLKVKELWQFPFFVSNVCILCRSGWFKRNDRWAWGYLDFKGTTRGLSGVFLPLVMNPLCPLKYYDRSITSPWSLFGVVSMGLWFAMLNITPFYGKNRSECSVMLLDPWMSP